MNNKGFSWSKLAGQKPVVYIMLLISIAVGIAVPILLNSDVGDRVSHYLAIYRVGEIADSSYYAKDSVSYIDTDATNALKEEAADAVIPVFSFSRAASEQSARRRIAFEAALDGNDERSLRQFFESGGATEGEAAHCAMTLLSMNADDKAQFKALFEEIHSSVMKTGVASQDEINAVYDRGYHSISYSNDYSGLDAEYNETPLTHVITYDYIAGEIASVLTTLSPEASFNDYELISYSVFSVVVPNLLYDPVATDMRRTQARDGVQNQIVRIEEGDAVITKDTVITEADLQDLLVLLRTSERYTGWEIVGRVIYMIIIAFGGFLAFVIFSDDTPRKAQYFVLYYLSNILVMVAVYFLYPYLTDLAIATYDPFLPVLFAPIFLALACGKKRYGVVACCQLAAQALLLPYSNILTFFHVALSAVACTYFIRFLNRRIEMLLQWLIASLVCAFLAVCEDLILGAQFQGVVVLIVGSIINVSLAYIVVNVAVPVAERILNLPTSFRLHELAYSDSPLLNKLSQVCQGTYNHSRSVAELAYKACEEIGENADLARVCGLYHDVGKMDHPEYFVENQTEGNKHDDIKPSLSVAIIKSHVKLGMEKARDAGLPPEVVKIIGEHHGNDVIRYFYYEAKKEVEASGGRLPDVIPADYSYTSQDPPSSKVSGVVMLADTVEAASHTLKNITPASLEKFVKSLVMGKLERGQLDNSNLTLTEIAQIEQSFVTTLTGIYHNRIEYPEDDKK